MDTTKTFEGGEQTIPKIRLSQVANRQTDKEETNWQDLGNCLGVDPDLFFPERGASVKEAKAVCAACVVREECLEYALANREKFGIWGGMSERERGRIRRSGAIARRAASATISL